LGTAIGALLDRSGIQQIFEDGEGRVGFLSMTVTRVHIQVGSTDWAKSPAIRLAKRSGGNVEAELVGGRAAQVYLAVLDGIAVLVGSLGEMLSSLRNDLPGPFGETANTHEMGGRPSGEFGDDPIDGPPNLRIHRHLAFHSDITDTQ
jgi:hypothetical protein